MLNYYPFPFLFTVDKYIPFLSLTWIFNKSMKGAQIDYASYSSFMRGALSGPEICNKDNSLNHAYFNTKKGFYWSEKHAEQLVQGVLNY
jgi:hypothetical protein